ncbi:MAG: transposase [Tannerella sp.]|jgi:putative transposase|nr:transposase [Tannerella sp.]
MKRKYETDLTNAQWKEIKTRYKELNGNYGENSRNNKRKVINAVLYRTKTGWQWRMLPKDFPKRSTVWSFCRRAKLTGLWEVILSDMVAVSRVQADREL